MLDKAMPSFRAELAKSLERRDLTQLAYGAKLGHRRNGTVSAVLKGIRPLPLDALDEWIEALDPDDAERERLLRLAIADYAPPFVRRLLGRLDANDAELAELRQRLRTWRPPG